MLRSPDSDASENLRAMDLVSPLSTEDDNSLQSDELVLNQGMHIAQGIVFTFVT